MRIGPSKQVEIDYVVTDDHGEVLESGSLDRPLRYVHGENRIMAGLESALEGRQSGDEISLRIEPEQGFGLRNERLVTVVPRSTFADVDPEVGERYQVDDGNGRSMEFTVVSVGFAEVTVDANHPLAGEALNFLVRVRRVEDAQAPDPGARAEARVRDRLCRSN